jgi:hypothetical protein
MAAAFYAAVDEAPHYRSRERPGRSLITAIHADSFSASGDLLRHAQNGGVEPLPGLTEFRIRGRDGAGTTSGKFTRTAQPTRAGRKSYRR